MTHSNNFLHCVRPLLTLCRLWGLNSFTLPPNRSGKSKLQVTSFDVKILCAQIIIYNTLAIVNMYILTVEWNLEPFTFPQMMNRLLYYSGGFGITFNAWLHLQNRSSIWFIIRSLCDFDFVVGLFFSNRIVN